MNPIANSFKTQMIKNEYEVRNQLNHIYGKNDNCFYGFEWLIIVEKNYI